MSVAQILFGLGEIVEFFLYQIIARSGPRSCPYLPTIGFCSIVRVPKFGGLIVTILTFLLFALERCVATWNYKTYEQWKNPVVTVSGVVSLVS